ncbi:MAG TPA: EAL domain-containing protein [Mycobacteriales bacterium]|nr:EAL domain-containing protein [Mycobacteriales bacterium]
MQTSPTGAVADEPVTASIAAEQLWRTAAQESADGIFGLDPAGLITDWTPAAARLFGYSAEEMVGRRSLLLFVSRLEESHQDRVDRVLAGERIERIAATARHRDGALFPVALTMTPLPERSGICVVVHDLTEQRLAQEMLAESNLRFEEAQQLAHVGLWVMDARTHNIQMTAELCRIHRVDPRAFEGTIDAFLELVHPQDRDGFARDLRSCLTGGATLDREHRIVRPDGSVGWVAVHGTVQYDEEGRALALRGTCQDITGQVSGEKALRRQAEVLDLLRGMAVAANESTGLEEALDAAVAALCADGGWRLGRGHVIGPDGPEPGARWLGTDSGSGIVDASLVDEVSPLVARVVAEREAVWVGEVLAEEVSPFQDATSGAGWSGFAFPVRADAEIVAVIEVYSATHLRPDRALIDATTQGAAQLGVAIERLRAREALAHQARHDVLTDLPNRSMLMERLRLALRRLDRSHSSLAVIFIDLDDFKVINDGLGHEIGDRCLSILATRLQEAMRPGDLVARFGGDEFVLLCEGVANDEAVANTAVRLLELISRPIELSDGAEIELEASLGIVIASDPSTRAENLIRDADAAMYRAKEKGGGRYQIFDVALHERAARWLALAGGLRRAVDNSELRLEFQPQIRINDGAILGFEALVRWQHPDEGLLQPREFIGVAEQTRLINTVGDWVLYEACRQAARWKAMRSAATDLRMCVNVSAAQLNRPGLVDVVAGALSASALPPAALCVEITESVIMSDPALALKALVELKALGIVLAVDDFGTGYSSLAYLNRFPIDVIKIDKEFVSPLGQGNGRARSILRSVVDLSRALGAVPVPEGVETAEQLDDLRCLGCEVAQGFLLGMPQPAKELDPQVANVGMVC